VDFSFLNKKCGKRKKKKKKIGGEKKKKKKKTRGPKKKKKKKKKKLGRKKNEREAGKNAPRFKHIVFSFHLCLLPPHHHAPP
jgi:hypothetical protein